MKTRIIGNRWIPFRGFAAVTLFGFIFTRDRSLVTPEVFRHELIHCRQQKELLYIPFFIIYLAEYAGGLIKWRDAAKAYRGISFEREAYRHQSEPGYLGRRIPYAQFRGFSR